MVSANLLGKELVSFSASFVRQVTSHFGIVLLRSTSGTSNQAKPLLEQYSQPIHRFTAHRHRRRRLEYYQSERQSSLRWARSEQQVGHVPTTDAGSRCSTDEFQLRTSTVRSIVSSDDVRRDSVLARGARSSD